MTLTIASKKKINHCTLLTPNRLHLCVSGGQYNSMSCNKEEIKTIIIRKMPSTLPLSKT